VAEPQPSFAPRTNRVSADMASAQAYLRDDVFVRLSQAAQDAETPAPSPRARPRRACSPLSRSRSEASLGLDGTLYSFLERQNACEAQRLRRLGDLEAAVAPALFPELCERSLRLAERQRERPASAGPAEGRSLIGTSATSSPAAPAAPPTPGRRGELGRTAPEGCPAPVPPLDPECTFRPKITRAAREHREQARSPSQLGPAEERRRAARRARAAEEKARREGAELRPPKVTSYPGVGGRLRIRTEADTLMARIEKARRAERNRLERDAAAQRKLEAGQCPFRPQVRSAPAFIRRMAASRREARALARAGEGQPGHDCGGPGAGGASLAGEGRTLVAAAN